MKTFLDSRGEIKFVKYRLGKLPELPKEEAKMGMEEIDKLHMPDRKAKPFKPGEGMIHGFYANSQPEAEVLAVMTEDIQGIEEEIAGLRMLARGIVRKQKEAFASFDTAQYRGREAMQAAEVHSRAAARVVEMVAAEKQLKEGGQEDTWTEVFLEKMDKIAMKMGKAPVSEAVRREAQKGDPELGIDTRCLAEEIATVRYMLRNVLKAALECEELADYMRMVEIYGSGCVRLVRMLKRERADSGRLRRYIDGEIDKAVRELNQEWGR
jgi:hypothetical protein